MKKLCLIFTILLFSLSEARVFSDTNDYLWASKVVDEWSDRGIISGYIDGTFKGNANLKRSEMIAVINKLNNSKEKLEINPSRDVKKGDWYYDDMCNAVKNGLIELDDDYNLRPNDCATREEVFVILAKLFNLKYLGNSTEMLSNKFNDYMSINGENYPYVAALVEGDYISGYNDNTIRPKSLITRAELVTIIDRMVAEVYSGGEHSDENIIGNLLINGNGVSLDNVHIAGNMFIMDGAKKEPPILNNISTTKGVVSRIGTVFASENNDEIDFEEEKTAESVFMRVRYSEEKWTNDDVEVIITFSDSDYDVINNSGNNSYKFKENGEFTFVAENSVGDTTEFKAKVNNIDKIKPKFETNIEATDKSAKVTLTIQNDELSPIIGAYYYVGNNSTSTVLKKGTLIKDNTFEVDEEGKYTIVVEDEAGNKTRKIITIEFITGY